LKGVNLSLRLNYIIPYSIPFSHIHPLRPIISRLKGDALGKSQVRHYPLARNFVKFDPMHGRVIAGRMVALAFAKCMVRISLFLIGYKIK